MESYYPEAKPQSQRADWSTRSDGSDKCPKCLAGELHTVHWHNAELYPLHLYQETGMEAG